MTIVVDIGCAERAGESSMQELIDRFQPTKFYGFDPGYKPGEKFEFVSAVACDPVIRVAAAWTYNGSVGFRVAGIDGIRSYTDPLAGNNVICFDLAEFLRSLPEQVILKMDCEGAEYTLIPHLIETGAIGKVELLLIEWHKPEGGVLETNGVAPIHVPVSWELWG